MPSPAARLYIYRVLLTLIPLLLLSRVLTPEWVPPITDAIAATLGLSGVALAAPNVPATPEPNAPAYGKHAA